MTASDAALQRTVLAATAASDKLATDLVALDVSEHIALTDAFLICSGRNERMVQAIADHVEQRLLEDGARRLRQEGRAGGRWILLDFGDIVVHVFHEEERLYYQLERLWRDCPVISLPAGLGLNVDSDTEQAL
ncbi:ribosome silencing factor [Pontimonas sp.]|jgi:ribosome-associated protein|nr:ribosome silencing factor [Microbacteriaceae bacterium]MDA8777428.1 ribosome silencing factor [Pontimonas sp.]MDA9786521.1 ribosome silencing factor [Pontimonas sp.]